MDKAVNRIMNESKKEIMDIIKKKQNTIINSQPKHKMSDMDKKEKAKYFTQVVKFAQLKSKSLDILSNEKVQKIMGEALSLKNDPNYKKGETLKKGAAKTTTTKPTKPVKK